MSKKEMADKINDWINNGDGKSVIRKASKEVEKQIKEYNKARKIDQKTLHEVFDI